MIRPRRFSSWRVAHAFALIAFYRHNERRHTVKRVPGAYGLPVWEVRPL